MPRLISLLLMFFVLFPAASLHADSPPVEDKQEQDEDEGPSPWYKNIVPVPIIITEPAVGDGLGVAISYFHPARRQDGYQPKSLEDTESLRDMRVARKPPPVVTAVFGALTSNGTWAGGIGHMNNFRNDSIRYLGVVGIANVTADFYVLDKPFEFNLEGVGVLQDAKFRIGHSDWFLGVALSYLDGTTQFRIPPLESVGEGGFGFLASEFVDSGVEANVMYESRDDSVMPGRGQLLELSVRRNGSLLSGDYDYTTTRLKFLSFHSLHARFVLGLRAEYATIFGDPPFFAIPWVELRGIPAMRFQGEGTAVVEVEGRFNFNENWAAVAFYGRGWTNAFKSELETEKDIDAIGAGVRWRALKSQGIWVGLDFARGPEDTVYYVQVGHAW